MFTHPVGNFGKLAQQPIMEFQTNKNGTFNPIITPTSGTLIWEIDGTLYTTNSPSVALTGDTVDVRVFANNVVLEEDVAVDMSSQYIIGELDFSHFTINGVFHAYLNPNLTSILFSSSGNSSDIFNVSYCNLSTLDVSSFTFTDHFQANDNNNLSSISFSASGNSTSNFRVKSCNLSSLDVSSFTLSGIFWTYSNSNLTSLLFSSSVNSSSDFLLYNCNLSSLDLSSFTFSGNVYVYANPNLTSISFSSNSSSVTNINIGDCDINGTLDLSSFTINGGIVQLRNNTSMTNVLFSSSGNSSNNFRINNCNLISLDLSGFQFDGLVWLQDNENLNQVTWNSTTPFLQNISSILFSRDALSQSEVDEIFSIIEDYFSVNTPLNDLQVNTDLGTNAAPSTAGLADIATIEGYFTTAGFTFTANTN
jgi:hypothetical protein